jgi:hypothetical protein
MCYSLLATQEHVKLRGHVVPKPRLRNRVPRKRLPPSVLASADEVIQ